MRLTATTIRNVSRGVIGVALLQAILGGTGFVAAGIPAAGFLAFLTLVLGIIQIGPTILFIPIVIWAWLSMSTLGALIFTVYMIPVALIDNILKPIIMSHGVNTPMPVIVIGVIGGTVSFGLIGLFLGPILLSVAWVLAWAWVQEKDSTQESAGKPVTSSPN